MNPITENPQRLTSNSKKSLIGAGLVFLIFLFSPFWYGAIAGDRDGVFPPLPLDILMVTFGNIFTIMVAMKILLLDPRMDNEPLVKWYLGVPLMILAGGIWFFGSFIIIANMMV